MPLAEDLYKNESNTIGENSYGFAHERLFFVTVFGGKNTLKRANIETKKKNIFLKCVHQHRSMSFFFFFYWNRSTIYSLLQFDAIFYIILLMQHPLLWIEAKEKHWIMRCTQSNTSKSTFWTTIKLKWKRISWNDETKIEHFIERFGKGMQCVSIQCEQNIRICKKICRYIK